MIPFFYKTLANIHYFLHRIITKVELSYINAIAIGYCLQKGVKLNPKKVRFMGKVRLNFHKGSNVCLNDGFVCRSGSKYGTVTNERESAITVCEGGNLNIGFHSGVSNVNIYCSKGIYIGNNVNIGSGTVIYDTDFHSLDSKDRKDGTDTQKRKEAPIEIKDLAFIGARCTILKGVTIGEKSIVGAGSVVTCNIPDGEIWGGNPAKFIRKAL